MKHKYLLIRQRRSDHCSYKSVNSSNIENRLYVDHIYTGVRLYTDDIIINSVIPY